MFIGRKCILVTGLFCFLSACSATGPKFQRLVTLDQDKAMIYLLRPYNRFLVSRSPRSVYIDKVIFYELDIDGYQFYKLEPGEHTINITASSHIRKDIYDETKQVILYKYIAEPMIVDESKSGTLHFNIKSGETQFFVYEHTVEYDAISFLLMTPIHRQKIFEVSRQEAIKILSKLRLSMEPFVRGDAFTNQGL